MMEFLLAFIDLLVLLMACLLSIYKLELIKYNKKDILINMICIISFCIIIISFIQNSFFQNLFINLLIGLIIYIQNRKSKDKIIGKIVFSVLTIDMVMSFFWNIGKMVLLNKFNLNEERISDYPAITTIMFTASVILLYISIYGLKKYLRKIDYSLESIFQNRLLGMSVLGILIFNFFVQSIISYIIEFLNYNILVTNVLSLLIFMSTIITVVICYVLIYYSRKQNQYELRQVEYERLREYTENLEVLYNDMRVFKHDYVNILSTMNGYFEQNKLEDLREYFTKKILPLSKKIDSKNIKLGLLSNIKVIEFKGLIAAKILKAQSLGIDVFIDIMESIDYVNMDIIDLCRVIGIILDNAIEASIQCNKPMLKLGIIKKNNSIGIVVINNYKGEQPKIHKIFEKGFSSKGENRGLGLYNLQEILKKYNHTSIDTIINENEFIQNIEIAMGRNNVIC